VYLHWPPANVAASISSASTLYGKVGLCIGRGPVKSELALPSDVDSETLPLPRGNDGHILPQLVQGLEACLGIPRYRGMCVDFITKAMRKPAAHHQDRLLLLVKDIAEEPPLTALRLLQVCGVNTFLTCHLRRPPGDFPFVCGGARCSSGPLPRGSARTRGDRTIYPCTSGGSGRRIATFLSVARRRKPSRHVLPHCGPPHCTLPHDGRSYSKEGSGAPSEPDGSSGWQRVDDAPP